MTREIFYLLGLLLGGGLAIQWLLGTSSGEAWKTDPAYQQACEGPPLRTLEARDQALTDGYQILGQFDCRSKESYREIEQQKLRQTARAAEQRQPKPAQAGPARLPLAQERRLFTTQVRVRIPVQPLPNPPPDWFVKVEYPSAGGLVLPAFVTPDPRDGERRPAIIWLTGGDSNSLDDFWVEGPPSNDQSAAPLRKAGLVMMFPTLRGGNGHPSGKEFFYGEVDDVLAAADFLAAQPQVDPDQIYLGGHSSGATLALLVAETSPRFKAVFAFGPVARIDRYGQSLLPPELLNPASGEVKRRSPIHWLDDIGSPTFVLEGSQSPNQGEVEALRAASRNQHLTCLTIPGRDHFSLLAPATTRIAARILSTPAGDPFRLPDPADFAP